MGILRHRLSFCSINQRTIYKNSLVNLTCTMDVLAPTIEQMILKCAICVHWIVEVAAKPLQLMRSIRIRLNLTLIKRIWLFKIHAADVATFLKVITVLYFGNFFYCLYTEIFSVEAHLLLGHLLPKINSLSWIENFFKECAFIGFIKYLQRWPIQKFLHNVALISFLENVFVDPPIFQFNLQHFIVLFLLFVQLSVISDEVDHHFEGFRIPINKNFILFFLKLMPTWKHSLESAALDVAEGGLSDLEVFVAAYVKFEDLTQRLYLLDLFFFTFPSLLLCLERKSVFFEILYLYLEFFHDSSYENLPRFQTKRIFLEKSFWWKKWINKMGYLCQSHKRRNHG